MNKLFAFLDQQPKYVLWVLATATLVALGVTDWATGETIALSVLYLVPVALAAWGLGRDSGLVFSVASAIVWIVVNPGATEDFTHPLLLAWNFFMRAGFFFVVTLLIVEIKRLLSHEQHLARTDFLTGALNRLAFYSQATIEIERSARFDHGLSLVYIDVDDFKSVNDRLGHNVGDHLLKEVAATIAANIRGIDTMARLGGDEFVVLLPQTDQSSANTMVVRLQQALLANMAAKSWPATFSIGVVTSPLAPYSIDELIKIADSLMYRAKNSGKNAIVQEVSGVAS